MALEERRWLSSLNMELYVPILRQHELVGLLAFGPQPQGTAYYEEDLELMTALADQAALAIDGAHLFEQLALINQEVGQLNDRLAGLDQNKTDFLSIASHELRTPLTHIHGYSRMLLELTEDELRNPTYVKTLIEGVVKGSERMKDVVDMMFDVTEADVGEMNLFLGPVALEEVLEQASRPFLAALDERRIAFSKGGIRDLPMIEADGTRLVQAFENLIGNAIKYTPDGGMISVEGRSVTLDDLGPAVEIVVTDTGIGIAPEHQEQIFEKFFRVDDTLHHSTGKTKFKGAGPGLGLTLVKGIAEAHSGRVWVESLGQDELNLPGSKFFLVIPIERIKPQKEYQKQSQIETRHWRRQDLQPAKNE
jgi:signal transduction histidine kinase